ncbi:MAG: hypothetical protein M1824_001469 [Vezdaea acicularis]|nr:MAG: hypothetical protein M1824_001469 [Vezdaea acicularis]
MSGQQGRGNHPRSTSPRRDGPSNYRERDSGYSGSSTRGKFWDDRGGHGGHDVRSRGGRGAFQGGRVVHSRVSTGSSLPDLPAKVDVPASGRNLPEMGLKIVREVGTTTKIIVNHYELQSLPTNKNLPVPSVRSECAFLSHPKEKVAKRCLPLKKTRLIVHASFQGTVGLAFVDDDVSMGYSPQYLSKIDFFGHTTARSNQVEVTILNTGTLNIGLLVNYMQSRKMPLNTMGNKARTVTENG